ncbi:MAG: electron transport complex subunit RsxA [Candidatus Omnitrophota bacterium]|nr:electron transport complex subunit RsxA [Candidatus Omnitrophota bacterium]
MKELLVILINSVLINNFVLARFLGVCPFLGVSKKIKTALGMGIAVIFVMTLSSIVTSLVYNFILLPQGLVFLKTIVFILVIASLVQLVEMIIQKVSPVLYRALGIYLPLITTNCAILGVALINLIKKYNFIQSLIFGLGAGIGFTIALIIMAGIRERLELADLPRSLKGTAISLIVAGLLSIAFMGFSGLVKP